MAFGPRQMYEIIYRTTDGSSNEKVQRFETVNQFYITLAFNQKFLGLKLSCLSLTSGNFFVLIPNTPILTDMRRSHIILNLFQAPSSQYLLSLINVSLSSTLQTLQTFQAKASRLRWTWSKRRRLASPRHRLSFIVGARYIPYQLDSLLWRHNEPAISSIVDIIPVPLSHLIQHHCSPCSFRLFLLFVFFFSSRRCYLAGDKEAAVPAKGSFRSRRRTVLRAF